MAESKRQSIAGKIATPRVGPTKDVIDGDSILYKAVGARYVFLLFCWLSALPETLGLNFD